MMFQTLGSFLQLEVIGIRFLIRTSLIQLTYTCLLDLQFGTRHMGATFKTSESSSLYDCAAECVSYKMCKSFNFDLGRGTCHLNSVDDAQYLEGSRKEAAFIYSSIINWNQTQLGPCQNNPCGYTQRCSTERDGANGCEEFLPNIAKNKPACASSRHDFPAGAAVDGDVTAIWSSRSCFAVKHGDFAPWWQVDLVATYIVVEVRVTSRGDCCPERLHDFALDVYKADPRHAPSVSPQLCYMYNASVTEFGKTLVVPCTSHVTGRYLRLSGKKTKHRGDLLQFCEVQNIPLRNTC